MNRALSPKAQARFWNHEVARLERASVLPAAQRLRRVNDMERLCYRPLHATSLQIGAVLSAVRRRGEREGTPATPVRPVAMPWSPPPRLGRRGIGILAAVVLLVQLPLIHYALLRPKAPVRASLPYRDDFSDPGTVATHYWSSGGDWRVVAGELLSPGVRNNPLWLEAPLPTDAAVEFDVRSESPEGDIKVELFGDGYDHASGYVLIHGGWNNSVSVIARLDEHGPSLEALERKAAGASIAEGKPGDLAESGIFRKDTRMRVEARPFPVERSRKYHWRIERRGRRLSWIIDGTPFMSFEDPFPLSGPGHDRFGFSSWESQLYFDNLTVTAL